jgi:hypothetical protein
MSVARKIAAILVADVIGYSRLASADEDRTLSRLRALRSDLIDPAVAVHREGDIDDAKAPLPEASRLNPRLSVKWMAGTKLFPNYSQPWYGAMRQAGLPEE